MKDHPIILLMRKFRRWWRLQREDSVDAFERGRREHIQRVVVGLVPLRQIGSVMREGYVSPVGVGPRPGTLSITVGDESVTLDPLDAREKFLANMAKCDSLLAKANSLPNSEAA